MRRIRLPLDSTFDVRRCTEILALLLISSAATALNSAQGIPIIAPWPNHGGGLANRREAPISSIISKETISSLAVKWSFNASNQITATPAIADGTIYFATWTDGNVYAVNAATGYTVWTTNVSEATGRSGIFSRATPTVADEYLILGVYAPGLIIALFRGNGSVAWTQIVEESPYAQILTSGTAYNGSFFVGVSSNEEQQYANKCCTFRGSFLKMEAHTGTILWKQYMVPDNHGEVGFYSGAAVWGSSPAIDIAHNTIYIATGNDYSVPPEITACQAQHNNSVLPDPCFKPGDLQESVVALDLDTGEIQWSTHLGSFDVYVNDCHHTPHPYCPPLAGDDYDFGECPMLLSIPALTADGEETIRDVLALGQKSGVVWMLDRLNGSVIWATAAGPGGSAGGATWGSATDGIRIYTNIVNSKNLNFTLRPSSEVINGGAWVAMNASTGDILWSTAVPGGYYAHGPVSISNGVVLVGSAGPPGGVYGLDAETGSVLWSAPTVGSVYGGFSVDDCCGYIGTGVNANAVGKNTTGGQTIYAFCPQ